jgi:hypothetical protein
MIDALTPTGAGAWTVGPDEVDAESEMLARAALDLARRFAAGATMWCVAPSMGEHASHVAVEFVHPVIVGKRALPAVTVPGPDYAATLRLASKPGDILLLMAPAGDEVAQALLRRAEAWGLVSVWIGAGARPAVSGPAHVVWVDDVEIGVAARTGALVLRYHLLWELTHVVFEHPGLLADGECCRPADDHCVTCSDDGVVVEVVEVSETTADVRAGGRRQVVDVSLIDRPRPDDLLLVQAGVALTKIEDQGRIEESP